MPIDPSTETLVSLSEAARQLPRRRAGKRPHVSCLYRWATAGCRGVVLESLQCGGTRVTSREALTRFFGRLSNGGRDDQQVVRSAAKRERATAAAIAELQHAGI